MATIALLLLPLLPLQPQSSDASEWVQKLSGPDSKIAEAALIALRREAVPALIQGYAEGSVPLRTNILRIAEQIGTQAAELAPIFAATHREAALDESLGWRIAPVIGALGLGRRKAAETWGEILVDAKQTPEARGYAILGVASLSEDGEPAIEALLAVLSERPVTMLQPLAAHALGKMPKAAVSKIGKRLKKLEGIEFSWHLLTLVHCGEKAKPVAKSLPPYALTNDWKQHGFVQRVLEGCASARSVEDSRKAEVEREGKFRKGVPMPPIYREEPNQFREMLANHDPKFADPEYPMDFPERLPMRIIAFDFGLGDIEEGLGQHLLDSLVTVTKELDGNGSLVWAAIHRRLDGLAGLAEGLAVLHDQFPARTQPEKD